MERELIKSEYAKITANFKAAKKTYERDLGKLQKKCKHNHTRLRIQLDRIFYCWVCPDCGGETSKPKSKKIKVIHQ